MKNYVRSIDKLSKNPENNLMNVMVYQNALSKKGPNGEYEPQPPQPPIYPNQNFV